MNNQTYKYTTMKKLSVILLALMLGGSLLAQTEGGKHRQRPGRPEPPKIEEMVSDLSAIQKKKLETINKECKEKTAKLQKELDNVRSNIRTLMNKEGNQSDKLFPLFDREAALQAKIAKEMYSTRQQIDQVLTEKQLAEFRARLKADRQNHKLHSNKAKPIKPRH